MATSIKAPEGVLPLAFEARGRFFDASCMLSKVHDILDDEGETMGSSRSREREVPPALPYPAW